MDRLVILWTSENKEIALDMVLMYTLKSNVNKWWSECTLITWGPSNKLVCEDEDVKEQIRLIMDAGVKVYACLRCAKRYDLTEKLESMGIEVKLMGESLTEYLSDGNCRVISI